MSSNTTNEIPVLVGAASSQQGGFAAASAHDSGLSSPSSRQGEAALPTATVPATITIPASALGNLPQSSGVGTATNTSAADAQSSSTATTTTTTTTGTGEAKGIKIDIDGAKQRGQELLQQGREQAKELVDSKPEEDRTDAEAHVGNLASGLAGVVLTAPLAAVEKASPALSHKIEQATSTIGQSLSNAAHSAGPTAQHALESVKSYLPAALGGTGTNHSTTTGTTSATGNTATSASQTVSETARSAGQSVSNTATSAGQSVSAAAQSYLPASIANKLPGGATGSTGTGTATGNTPSPFSGGTADVNIKTGSESASSPYTDRSNIEPKSTVDADQVRQLASGGSSSVTGASSSPDFRTAGTDANRTTGSSTLPSDVGSGRLSGAGAPAHLGGSSDYSSSSTTRYPETTNAGTGTYATLSSSSGARDYTSSTSTTSAREPSSSVSSSTAGGTSNAVLSNSSGVKPSYSSSGELHSATTTTSAPPHQTQSSKAANFDSKHGDGVFDVPVPKDVKEQSLSSGAGGASGVANKQDDDTQTFNLTSGAGLGSTAESDVPLSSSSAAASGERHSAPTADPRSAAAAEGVEARGSTTVGGHEHGKEGKEKMGLKAKLAKMMH